MFNIAINVYLTANDTKKNQVVKLKLKQIKQNKIQYCQG